MNYCSSSCPLIELVLQLQQCSPDDPLLHQPTAHKISNEIYGVGQTKQNKYKKKKRKKGEKQEHAHLPKWSTAALTNLSESSTLETSETMATTSGEPTFLAFPTTAPRRSSLISTKAKQAPLLAYS